MRVLTAGESSTQVAGKSDGVLSNREKPGSAAVLGTKRETPVKCLKGIRACSCKKVTVSDPAEVPLYQCTQHGY